METNQTLRAKIQAGKMPMNEKSDFSETNVGHLRKGTVTKDGQEFERGKSAEDLMSELGGPHHEQSSGPKVKYMGIWDAGLGRMVYEPIEELSSDLLLGQEKVAQPYLTCARDGRSERLFEEAIEENVSGNPKEEGGLKRRKEPEENVAVFQNGRGGPKTTGPATFWKKRARQGRGSPRISAKMGTPDGKRNIEKMAAEEITRMPKKSRKFDNLLFKESEVMAGIVAQP
jgi:hypothetical protein